MKNGLILIELSSLKEAMASLSPLDRPLITEEQFPLSLLKIVDVHNRSRRGGGGSGSGLITLLFRRSGRRRSR